MERIERGLAEVAVGVIYDSNNIRNGTRSLSNQREISELLKQMPLTIKIWHYGQPASVEPKDKGWNTLKIDGLAASIRDAVNNVIGEDTLAKAVEMIEAGVDKMASKLLDL